MHQAAYKAHDDSRGRLSNIYANTRRVAGLMTAFEDDDYKLQASAGMLACSGFCRPICECVWVWVWVWVCICFSIWYFALALA